MRRTTVPSLLLACLLAISIPCSAFEFSGKVADVLDGDTIVVSSGDGLKVKVRLAGIDCPELDQPFGKEAKQFTSKLVLGKTVSIVMVDVDRYGRIVGKVLIGDGKELRRELLKAGYAWWYRHYSKDISLGKLEAKAMLAGRGLWKDQEPVPPWEWREKGRPASATMEVSRPTAATTVYHGNVRSHVFHRPGCRYYNCRNCTAIFRSREEAMNAGFRPCSICRP